MENPIPFPSPVGTTMWREGEFVGERIGINLKKNCLLCGQAAGINIFLKKE